jgi:hypothetical protein
VCDGLLLVFVDHVAWLGRRASFFLHVAVMRSTQRGRPMYIHSSRLFAAAPALASLWPSRVCAVL